MKTETLWNGIALHTPEGQFPLGTDSVLLAHFAKQGKKVCDLCCGCGAVALMLLASDGKRTVTGVELQAEAAEAARHNAEVNHLPFSVLHGDIREIRSLLPPGSFDSVVSNPPYHVNGSDPARAQHTCTPEDLCKAAAWLLPTGGRFYFVQRTERLAELISALSANGLEPKQLQFIRHKPGSRRTIFLMEAVRGAKPSLKLLDDFILFNNNGTETEECRRAYHHEGGL